MGSLSPSYNIPLGSAIGEIGAPQPRSENLVPSSTDPDGVLAVSGWSVTGTCTSTTDLRYDAGFVTKVLAGPAGSGDTLVSPRQPSTPIVAGTTYTVSAQVSVDEDFTGLAVLANRSTKARLAVRWLNGGGATIRTDSVSFAPGSGAVLDTSSAFVSGVTVAPFVARVNTTGVQVNVNLISFQCVAPATAVEGLIVATPRDAATAGAAARCMMSGFQLEAYPAPTNFIANARGTNGIPNSPRNIGKLARQIITFSHPRRQADTGTDANYDWNSDDGVMFWNCARVLFDGPSDGLGATQSCYVLNNNPGISVALQAAGVPVPIRFYGPGLPSGGSATLVLPPSPIAGQESACIHLQLQYFPNTGLGASIQAYILSTNYGMSDAAGGIVPVSYPAVTFANLPAAAAGNLGQVYRVTNIGQAGVGSLWISTGAKWAPVNGRVRGFSLPAPVPVAAGAAQTIVAQWALPAGFFHVNDIAQIFSNVSKAGITTTEALGIYLGSVGTIAGDVALINAAALSAANRTVSSIFDLQIVSATSARILSGTTTAPGGYGQASASAENATMVIPNISNPLFITVTALPGVTDAVMQEGLAIDYVPEIN